MLLLTQHSKVHLPRPPDTDPQNHMGNTGGIEPSLQAQDIKSGVVAPDPVPDVSPRYNPISRGDQSSIKI